MNGTAYYYEVSAVNGVGEGPRSVQVSVTPQSPTQPPSEPQGLQAAPGRPKGVELTWSPPASAGSSAVESYRIYRSTTAGNEQFLASVGNVSAYRDSATTKGTVYYYKVTAVSSPGEGLPSNEATTKAR